MKVASAPMISALPIIEVAVALWFSLNHTSASMLIELKPKGAVDAKISAPVKIGQKVWVIDDTMRVNAPTICMIAAIFRTLSLRMLLNM